MIRRPFLSRVALRVLDRGPSLLRLALEGDAPARRILASVGVTPHDLTAIADARAARRRAAQTPPAARVPPGTDPLTMDADTEVQAASGAPGLYEAPMVLGPWIGGCRAHVAGPVGALHLRAHKDQDRRWFEVWYAVGAELRWCATADDRDTACADADAWARAQGWVLLDLEPGSLRGLHVWRQPSLTGGGAATWRRLDNDDLSEMLKNHTTLRFGIPDVAWCVLHPEALKLIAHGPQVGAEGERLLLTALRALGVDVLNG